MTRTIVFFGSFQQYSVQVLDALIKHFSVTGVVTTPPKPAGRHLTLTPTEIQRFTEGKNIPVFPLDSLEKVPNELAKPDFIVVAGYGKLIPNDWLSFPKIMAINMHASLLPTYRGGFPAEWAILRGEAQTGTTLVKMSPEFDKGDILAQKYIPIEPSDTRETLYRKLYDLGTQLLVTYLPKIADRTIKPTPQPEGNFFYARRLTRDDGFVPWEFVTKAIEGPSVPFSTIQHYTNVTILKAATEGQGGGMIDVAKWIERALRALSGWPGVWTTVSIKGEEKRLKILSCHLSPVTASLVLDTVQLEGNMPMAFDQAEPPF